MRDKISNCNLQGRGYSARLKILELPSKSVQRQQQKHQKKVWNIFKVHNKKTRTSYGVFIANFEHILHFFEVFLLLTLKYLMGLYTHGVNIVSGQYYKVSVLYICNVPIMVGPRSEQKKGFKVLRVTVLRNKHSSIN